MTGHPQETNPLGVQLVGSCCGGDCCGDCAGRIEPDEEFVMVLHRGGAQDSDTAYHLECWRAMLSPISSSVVART
jgi:hypothetical protein